MDGLTAKVFRTFNASMTLQDQLNKLTEAEDNVNSKVLTYNRANRAVAILCNHQVMSTLITFCCAFAWCYVISRTIHTFWLVLTCDLLKDRHRWHHHKASIFHVAGHYEVFYCILLHVHSVRLNQYYRCRCNHMKRLKFIHVAHYFFFIFFIYFSAQSPRPLKNQCPIYKRRCELVTFFPRVIYLGIHAFTYSIYWFCWFCCSVLDCYKEKSNQGCKKRTQGFEKSSKRKQRCKSDEVC